MIPRVFCLVLANLVALTALGLAAEPPESQAPPVVYLERSPTFSLRIGSAANGGILYREIARQSFLVAARDQLGLRTRDAWLGEDMPHGDENGPFEVVTTTGKPTMLEVRRGFPDTRKTLLSHDPKIGVAPPSPLAHTSFSNIADYRKLLEESEKLSRTGFVDAIRQAGFVGKPNVLKDTVPIPEEIEKALGQMNFMSQFSAIRQLHDLIRADGESPERIGGLVRGYAHLGLLTEFHWHPAHKVFKARSLVYAQRMVATDKQPGQAHWHRAYAFAITGLHYLALFDLKTAEKQWKDASKDASQRLGWVDSIDAYCRFDYARLKREGEAESRKELAALLRFHSIELSYHKTSILAAAVETAKQLPECYRAYETICEYGGVSAGHFGTSAGLRIAGKTLYSRVAANAGLPEAVRPITAAGMKPVGDERVALVEEFRTRGKLVRALLESDGAPQAKAGSVKPAAKPSAAPAALDRGEPTWVCLGQLISNLNFVQVWRRVQFQQGLLAVPADDFVKISAPLVASHPYREYIATHVSNPAAQQSAWSKLTLPGADALELHESPMWGQYEAHHPFLTFNLQTAIDSQIDSVPRDYAVVLAYVLPEYNNFTATLLGISPFSPCARAVGIEHCGNYCPKATLAEWQKTAATYPAVALAFARRALATKHLSDAEKWLKVVVETGDPEAAQKLADVYKRQGKMELSVATLEDYLDKSADYGLSHALVRTQLARYYMQRKEWQKALPHAKRAGETWSQWGLIVAGDCLEATHEWEAAEEIVKAMGERYPAAGLEWYLFCRRTGHGDLAAARRAAKDFLAVKTNDGMAQSIAAYYLLEKQPEKARVILHVLVGWSNPVYELHLALLADQAKDVAKRDEALRLVRQSTPAFKQGSPRKYAALGVLAKLIADDLAKGGKGEMDLAAAEQSNPAEPAPDDSPPCQMESCTPLVFNYLLGRYFDLHGKPELAIQCWKKCMDETQYISDFHRTLAAAELAAHGVKLEETSRHEAAGEKP